MLSVVASTLSPSWASIRASKSDWVALEAPVYASDSEKVSMSKSSEAFHSPQVMSATAVFSEIGPVLVVVTMVTV